MRRLEGKNVIITGGAQGMGLVFSDALASEGATVFILDISTNTAAVEQLIDKYGKHRIFVYQCDVSLENQVKVTIEKILKHSNLIHILINNAAIFSVLKPTEPWDIETELWDKVMAVNVRGPFLMVKYISPHMIKQKYGKIINISSGTAYRGIPKMLHYVSSKGAMLGFSRALSRDLGKYGICVNTLVPGLVLSDTLMANNPEHVAHMRDAVLSTRSIKRDEKPDDLIGGLIFLASKESDFVTGQSLSVCGGTLSL
jgi:NAD(P)-dependent dehydrogenase (short-subunit alcohol dehydrogenase family)